MHWYHDYLLKYSSIGIFYDLHSDILRIFSDKGSSVVSPLEVPAVCGLKHFIWPQESKVLSAELLLYAYWVSFGTCIHHRLTTQLWLHTRSIHQMLWCQVWFSVSAQCVQSSKSERLYPHVCECVCVCARTCARVTACLKTTFTLRTKRINTDIKMKEAMMLYSNWLTAVFFIPFSGKC